MGDGDNVRLGWAVRADVENRDDRDGGFELLERPEWHERASCAGDKDAEVLLWSPFIDDQREGIRRFCRALDNRCPVIGECEAAGTHENHGVWGGIPERQRRTARRRLWASRAK